MRKKKDRAQFLFGMKCVLLSIALLLTGIHIIVKQVFCIDIMVVDLSIKLVEVACIVIVLVFEIRPYIQLYNEGIQAIYQEKNIEGCKIQSSYRT